VRGMIRTMTAAAAAGAATLSLTAASAATTSTTPAAKAGLTGKPIVLTNNAEFSGYDAAMDSAGTAYIGWIGNTGPGRRVSLCVLPKGAKSCKNGVQTIDSLDPEGSYGLQVLVTGPHSVTLVWQHITVASENGPQGDEITIATTNSSGTLGAAHDVATAPSFGLLMDAVVGPHGTIWVVSRPGGANGGLQVRPGFASAPVHLKTPYLVGYALLRFAGSTAVLAIDKDGAISKPVSYASEHNGSWSKFRPVAKTWTADANFGLASVKSGVRLIATVNNANYYPVVSRWTGSGFGKPTQTGDHNNCTPSSHDAVSDASGRLADASMECEDIAIANLPDTVHAKVFRYKVHGTFAGGQPQLTTTKAGTGWVAWSIESADGDKLLVAPLRLAK